MEHSCYQCGASVEDGIPFCRQCKAPQIRVAMAEGSAPIEMVAESPSEPTTYSIPTYTAALSVTKPDWQHGLRAAALAVLVSAAVTMFLGLPFGLGILGAGFLSVLFYSRRNPGASLTAKMGARLGALSGLFGFGGAIAFFATRKDAFRTGGEVHLALLKALQEHALGGADPQVMQQLFDFYKTPQGYMVMLAVGSVMVLAVFLVLSSLGGTLGAVMLRKKRQRS